MLPRKLKAIQKKGQETHQTKLDNFFKKSQPKDNKFKSEQQPPAKKIKHSNDDALDTLLLHSTLETKRRLRHCVLPAFNVGQCPMKSCDELLNYPKFMFSLRRPVYIANRHCNGVDICHRRTMARESYMKSMLIGRTRYLNTQKNNRNLRNAEKDGIYPVILFDMANRFEFNPDPFFHGSYDYYYTGGNLCILNDDQHIAHVDGEDLRNLNIGCFASTEDFNNTLLEPSCYRSFETNAGSEIFEVRPIYEVRKEHPNCFAVRQRNSITILSLQTEDNKRLKPLTQFKSQKVPFISFAQSSLNASTFLASDMKQNIRLFDLNKNTPTLAQSYKLGRDDVNDNISWNIVREWQDQTYLFANADRMCIADLRTTPDEWLKSCCGFSAEEMSCEFISTLAKSEFHNMIYVGTHHKLHCLDARYIKSEFESAGGAICRWTHQLEYAPALIDVFRNASSEFIALGSPLAGDMRICELTRFRQIEKSELAVLQADENGRLPKHLYKTYSLPWQPPTLDESYHSARMAGKCLQPDAELSNRISCCTTGLAFYSGITVTSGTPAHALMLTANSNGDVFAYTVTDRERQTTEKRTNEQSDAMMCEYAARVCELAQPNLNYTDVVDSDAIRKVFRCKALNQLQKEELEELEVEQNENQEAGKPKPKRRHILGRWHKSIQSLRSYKDVLAQDLLSIWDIEEDPSEKERLSLSYLVDIKPNRKSIVDSWLDESVLPKPTTVIPIQNLVNLNDSYDESFKGTQDLMEQQQSTQIMDVDAIMQMDNSASAFNISYGLTTTTMKPKTSKKKSKYVKGF